MQDIGFDPYADAVGLKEAMQPSTRVDDLKALVARETALSLEIATVAEKLSELTSERDNILTSMIPDLVRADDPMASAVTLDDGTVIELKDECHVSFNKADEQEVYDFVVKRGNESSLQYIFTVICGKGTHREAREIQAFLAQDKFNIPTIEVTGKQYIHPVTVKSLLKKLRAKVKLPECVKFFEPTTAKITINNPAKTDIFG